LNARRGTFREHPKIIDPITFKADLLKRIQETDDRSLLQQVKALLDVHAGGRWEGLPDAVKASILEGYAQSERNEGRTHEDVIERQRMAGS